ncbi:MAG TPA: HAD family hydrolase [Actinokineospora sp.]|nr:HAD family hydrolase [Actinokineospora sp.]
MRVEHIVWDWNGTLFDDGDALVCATIDAFAATGIAEVTTADFQAHFTRPITEFYERLAGRSLTDVEQRRLDEAFQRSYADRIDAATLHADAVAALSACRDSGRTQSLLSMYPHDLLTALRPVRSVAHYFVRVDGMVEDELPRKEPHLRRHLTGLDLDPARVLVVGDSTDDLDAAAACGALAVLYHPRHQPLLSHARVDALGVPVVAELPDAVHQAVGGFHGA